MMLCCVMHSVDLSFSITCLPELSRVGCGCSSFWKCLSVQGSNSVEYPFPEDTEVVMNVNPDSRQVEVASIV
jgi:hypothetical protein